MVKNGRSLERTMMCHGLPRGRNKRNLRIQYERLVCIAHWRSDVKKKKLVIPSDINVTQWISQTCICKMEH